MEKSLPKILAVEDDLSSIALLKLILEAYSELIIAKNGEEALEKASSCNPDLVLVDLDLPDISGIEVCRRLKADPTLTDVPIIFLTGYSDIMFEAQAFEAGAIDYIVKPVSPYRVLMRVNAHLNIRLPDRSKMRELLNRQLESSDHSPT